MNILESDQNNRGPQRPDVLIFSNGLAGSRDRVTCNLTIYADNAFIQSSRDIELLKEKND